MTTTSAGIPSEWSGAIGPVPSTREIILGALVEAEGGQYRPFDAEHAQKLADAFKRDGFRPELGVPEVFDLGGDRFEILSGHHRIAAARLASMDSIPCAVLPKMDRADAVLGQVAGNSFRLNAPASAEARAFSELVESGVTVETIMERTGHGRAYVERRLALMALDYGIRDMVDRLGFKWAEPLLAVDHATQRALVRVLDNTECNLAQWRELVRAAGMRAAESAEQSMFDAETFTLQVEEWTAEVERTPKVPSFIGIRGIAELFGVTPNLVRQWKHRGKLPEPTELVDGDIPVWGRGVIREWIGSMR